MKPIAKLYTIKYVLLSALGSYITPFYVLFGALFAFFMFIVNNKMHERNIQTSVFGRNKVDEDTKL